MSDFFRGLGQVTFRAVPALVGGYLGGAKGAQIGYELGAKASGSLFDDYNKTIQRTTNVYSPFNQMDSYSDNAQGRTKRTEIETDPSLTGLEKFGRVSDTINSAALNSPIGSKSKGALNKTPTTDNTANTNAIPNKESDPLTKELNTIQVPQMKPLDSNNGGILDSGNYMSAITSFLNKAAPGQFNSYKKKISAEQDLSPYNTDSILKVNF